MAIDLTPITSGYSTGKINENFQKLEDEINNNLLRRDGLGVGEGNKMENPLDMNSYDILNVNDIDVQGLSIQGQSIDGFVQRAEDAALSAEQDANSASTSETNAANSAAYAEQQADRAEAAADSSDALVLREDLEDSSNPEKGAAIVGIDGQTLRDYIKSREWSRSIESFGQTGTANDSAVIQVAVDYCASNGLTLTAKLPIYFIDQVTIPDNLKADFRGAWFLRVAGASPKDMLINADVVSGNTGLDIRNLRLDGRRQVDSLSNVNPDHRFCGLRLIKCEGYIQNIRADNTVNGEVQSEGIRGGIMLEDSVKMVARYLYADGTDGSGVFPYRGDNDIRYVWTANNTGSGFTSNGCDGNQFHYIFSDGSGYSGVSVNGEGMTCSHLYSKNSPINYAGVNIGHDAEGVRATGSSVSHVRVESALGWGITVIGSPDVECVDFVSKGSAVNNLRVINSPRLRISYRGSDTLGTDTFISGSGDHYIDCNISGATLNSLTANNGASVYMGEGSVITGGGGAGGFTGGVNAAPGTYVKVRGVIKDNATYGVIANGTTIDLINATVSGNASGNFSAPSGGVIRHQKTRTSKDAMTGSVTATTGQTSITVTNGNSINAALVRVWPGNPLATAKAAFVSSVSFGVSFTMTLASAAAGGEVYYWELI